MTSQDKPLLCAWWRVSPLVSSLTHLVLIQNVNYGLKQIIYLFFGNRGERFQRCVCRSSSQAVDGSNILRLRGEHQGKRGEGREGVHKNSLLLVKLTTWTQGNKWRTLTSTSTFLSTPLLLCHLDYGVSTAWGQSVRFLSVRWTKIGFCQGDVSTTSPNVIIFLYLTLCTDQSRINSDNMWRSYGADGSI